MSAKLINRAALSKSLSSALILSILLPLAARADEGMWLFNNPPLKILQSKYKFEPNAGWMEHLQKSSVRFNSGGSGSFVSSNGLVMTNHHVGADSLQKLSPPGKDYLNTGYYAKTNSDELKCPDLELNVLMEIEDVTAKVNAAVTEGMAAADAQKARRAAMNTIEKESLDKTGLRSDVVTLYQGGQYQLYKFKKYTDVRLVFAPEKDIASFGGDPDNFEYPRYDLDICFFRVYENGKPAKIQHYLNWSKDGAADGELVFVSGHPGSTNRLNTVNHLVFIRDVLMPYRLNDLARLEVLLKTYSDRKSENARQAQEDLLGVQNSRKARLGGLAGLQDPALIAQKAKSEQELRAAVAKDDKLVRECGTAWDEVDSALKVWKDIFIDHRLYEAHTAFNSRLFDIARTLVRLSEESQKPNADRLREYRESNLDSLKLELLSDAPIYPELEVTTLANSLSMLMQVKGGDNELVKKILDGKSPQERASELIRQSKLIEVSERKRLSGEKDAVANSKDPLIEFAKMIDPTARDLRKMYEQKVEEGLRQAYAKIAKAKFSIQGTSQYPDATFTLRLAFGEVKGYKESGTDVPPFTTLAGTYEHAAEHGNQKPFELPPLWIKKKDKIAGKTPFNFVSTADIIGGNSGSPVVNTNGELVGIIFDGNIQSLVLDFAYTDVQARAVSVHSSAIRESLQNVYEAKELVDELGH